MIRVELGFDSRGLLRSIRSRGHAGSASADVCVAVSLLLRRLGRMVASRPGLVVEGSAPEPGMFAMEIVRVSPEEPVWLLPAGDLVAGFLEDLAGSRPLDIRVIRETYKE